MAVAVNIYYSGENGNARKFAEEMTASGIAGRTRAEAAGIPAGGKKFIRTRQGAWV